MDQRQLLKGGMGMGMTFSRRPRHCHCWRPVIRVVDEPTKACARTSTRTKSSFRVAWKPVLGRCQYTLNKSIMDLQLKFGPLALFGLQKMMHSSVHGFGAHGT